MKNLSLLFIAFICFTVQSQDLTENEVSGTWTVVAIAESGTHPEGAAAMESAFFDLYPDHRFQLRMKHKNKPITHYEALYKNYMWRFDQSSQTIYL